MKRSTTMVISLISIMMTLLSLPVKIGAQKGDLEGKRQQATSFVIGLFDKLVARNILTADNLKHLLAHETLINPIDESGALSSHEAFTYGVQLNNLISIDKDSFIGIHLIHEWGRNKIYDLELQNVVREDTHQKTEKIYRPMEFVTIPAGQYTSSVDGSSIEIPEGIELQETPLTQYQWAQNMGDNPSKIMDGLDSEEIVIGDKKVTMRADAPVEAVSFNQIQKFINKLNEKDEIYSYKLPSVDEYDALLQINMGKNWIDSIKNADGCADRRVSCNVASSGYIESGKKRVWGVIDTVWQYTRDKINLKISLEEESHSIWDIIATMWRKLLRKEHIEARLVFGGSFGSKKEMISGIAGILRPVLYGESKGEGVGFRLVRVKKALEANQKTKTYFPADLSWDERFVDQDTLWKWNTILKVLTFGEDELGLMIEFKRWYPSNVQHTLNAIIKERNCIKPSELFFCLKETTEIAVRQAKIKNLLPFAHLVNLKTLLLEKNEIEDLSPLAHLTHLQWLDLESNQVKDISALSQLTHLKILHMDGNQIKDVSPLVQLTGLVRLRLENNHIDDIASFAHLTNLPRLFLSGNQIKDIVPLARLASLEELWLDNNQIQDLSPLAGHHNLRELNLDKNQIENITSLSQLAHVERLFLRDNQIKDLSPLAQLTHLTNLQLGNNQIEDVCALGGVT